MIHPQSHVQVASSLSTSTGAISTPELEGPCFARTWFNQNDEKMFVGVFHTARAGKKTLRSNSKYLSESANQPKPCATKGSTEKCPQDKSDAGATAVSEAWPVGCTSTTEALHVRCVYMY